MHDALTVASPPLASSEVDTDSSDVFGVALLKTFCLDCIIDHPPTFLAEGNW
jgi:hypothetical protein